MLPETSQDVATPLFLIPLVPLPLLGPHIIFPFFLLTCHPCAEMAHVYNLPGALTHLLFWLSLLISVHVMSFWINPAQCNAVADRQYWPLNTHLTLAVKLNVSVSLSVT